MKLEFCRKVIGLGLLATAVVSVNGAVVNVSTPVTKTTLQNAINSASEGDVVAIPSGNWNISGIVNLKEGIHIRGAGMNSTILNKTDVNENPIFKLVADAGKPITISGIDFKGIGLSLYIQDPTSTVKDIGISILGKARFRIHDCRFEKFTGNGIHLYGVTDSNSTYPEGHPVGVIYDNEFKDNYWVNNDSNNNDARGYGVGLYGDDSWPKLQLGTSFAVFVEDNDFTQNRHCIASNMGGRYVFRYNTIVDNYYPYAAIDAHGQSVGTYHGTRSYEIYENTVEDGVEWDDGPGDDHGTWGTGIRGGDGVIYNNTFSGMWRAMFINIEQFDSNMTYPVDDQIRDLWVWGNTLGGSAYNTLTLGFSAQDAIDLADFLQEGRDYYEDSVKPGYEAYVYPHPLRSLIGYWKLDNADSIQIDSSYSGNNATKYNSPASVSGYSGNALSFNGTSDYIDCTDTAELEVTGEMTISAWIKPTEGPNATVPQRTIASRYTWQTGGTGEGWYFGSSWQSNGLTFTIYNGTGTHGITSYGDFFTTGEGLNVWRHVVGVFKPNEYVKLYIDGDCVSTDSTSVPSSIPYLSATKMTIGIRSDDNKYFFEGVIDDVRYYSRALSQAEIKAMYNRVKDPSFESILGTAWSVRSGSPSFDLSEKHDGNQSIYFNKPSSSDPEVSVKMNNYIPVDGGKSYVLSVWAKGNNITVGTHGWHRLYVIGRWYDKNMVEISGVYPDISNISTGTFPWTKFEKYWTAPANAVYYRATAAGIISTGSGEGWLDLIEIRPSTE